MTAYRIPSHGGRPLGCAGNGAAFLRKGEFHLCHAQNKGKEKHVWTKLLGLTWGPQAARK